MQGTSRNRNSAKTGLASFVNESPREDLARAFLTFTQAASSLEHSYAQLQAEVVRLHQELERANHELDRSLEENQRVRAYLAQVLDRLPCGVLAANSRGEFQVLNPEARRLLEIPPDWQPGTAGLPEVLQPFAREFREARREDEWEMSVPCGGAERSIGVTREPVRSGNDNHAGTIWILRDLTEQRRVAAEKEAARRAQALAEVATVLAHEIRNPLGSMELFTGLLADASSHLPETRQWVVHLRAGLRSLSATVNNVLQFHAQPALQLLPADLGRLANETMDFLQPMAKQRGQTIRVQNALGDACVLADGQRLKQVFLNLALNAFRAMPPGGILTVRISPAPQFPEGLVRVEFSDDGRGIEAELLPRIFEPGFTTKHGSPGLGLSVCKKVVEQHRGEIEVRSRPQQGTTFTVLLPLAGGAA